MKTVNLHFAKTISPASSTTRCPETISSLQRRGSLFVRLVRIAASDKPRTLGSLAGKVRESKDCWAPDPDIESLFYDEPVEPKRVRCVAEARTAKRKR